MCLMLKVIALGETTQQANNLGRCTGRGLTVQLARGPLGSGNGAAPPLSTHRGGWKPVHPPVTTGDTGGTRSGSECWVLSMGEPTGVAGQGDPGSLSPNCETQSLQGIPVRDGVTSSHQQG